MRVGTIVLSQPLPLTQGGTEANSSSGATSQLGLTPTTAQYNASSLLGIPFSLVAPIGGQALTYNATSGKVEWITPSASGLSSTDSLSEGTTNLYFTQARVFNSLSATNGVSYSSGQFSRDYSTYSSYGFLSDHFTGISTSGIFSSFGFTSSTSGTGSSLSSGTGAGSNPGILTLQTGTTTTGGAYFRTGLACLLLGSYTYSLKIIARVATLPNSTESFKVNLGFADPGTPATTPGDGAYFSLDQNSSNWICYTSNNSTSTTTDSGVAATTSFTTLRIEVTNTASSVTFYINDVLVATHTTNIPKTSGRETGIAGQIIKSLGTTTRTLEVDYVQLSWSI